MNDETPTNQSSIIAKNTMFLYIRSLVSILINLYTMKVLWLALGIEDYGVYTLVGGIVTLFSFISNSMTGAIQRYMSYAIGKGDQDYLERVFSVSIRVQIILIAIVLIIGETIGLWAVNFLLKIPEDKMIASNFVYQSCLISFLLTIISVPYNAAIASHEHMHIYGYYGIVEVFLRLFIVLVIKSLPSNRLIAYSILLVLLSIFMRWLYMHYCKKHFPETKVTKKKSSELIKEMFNFQKWTFVGLVGFSARDGGMGIVLNHFFSMSIIASKGITGQIGNVISGFASNFTMAVNPQIIKRYANNNYDGMINLAFSGCKYALLLMSFVSLPLMASADLVLNLWLKDPTVYTIGFLQYVLLIGMIESVIGPITTSIQATGNIKWFQILISVLMLSIIPISWGWIELYRNPYIVYYVMLLTSVMGIVLRLMILHRLIKFSYKKFLSIVYLRTLPAIASGYLVCRLLYQLFSFDFIGLVEFVISAVVALGALYYAIALTKNEKLFVKEKIMNFICTKIKKR